MDRLFAALGAVLAFCGVAAGAFGAHGLKGHFADNPGMEKIWETASEYHMYHALALLAVAWAAERGRGALLTVSGLAFTAGIVLFSGSLYALSLTTIKTLGMITPIGGVAFLIGWACLGVGVLRRRED